MQPGGGVLIIAQESYIVIMLEEVFHNCWVPQKFPDKEVAMSTEVQAMSIQTIEMGVTGPDDVNRMFVTNGMIKTHFVLDANMSATTLSDTKTYAALVGPPLGGGQFRRAIAIASIKNIYSEYLSGSRVGWEIVEVEADFDDEHDRVELRVTVHLQATRATILIEDIAFQATILAKMD